MENIMETVENAVEETVETVTEVAAEATEAATEAAAAATAEAEEKKTLILWGPDRLLVAPVGRLDTVMSGELKELLEQQDLSRLDIEMDFAGVDYISSAGLRLLVALQKEAKSGGHGMVIKNTNAVVNEVFRVSGFNKAFTIL